MFEEGLKELIKEAVREVLDEREEHKRDAGSDKLTIDEQFQEMLNPHGLKRTRLGNSIELDEDEDESEEEPVNKRLQM